jgi:hypothetical protein
VKRLALQRLVDHIEQRLLIGEVVQARLGCLAQRRSAQALTCAQDLDRHVIFKQLT